MFCSGCAHGKNHHVSFPVNEPRDRSHKIGVFCHADVCVPMSVPSTGDFGYLIRFKCDQGVYRIVYYILNKCNAYECFQSLGENHLEKLEVRLPS
jgi:hypothetical protein